MSAGPPGTAARPGPPRAAPRRTPRMPPAGGRGALVISERARNRIAAQAVTEALGRAVPVPPRGTPAAAVAVRRGSARIRLDIALPYPCDIAALCAYVQEAVAARSAELTGTPVHRVDLTVDRLEHPADPAPGPDAADAAQQDSRPTPEPAAGPPESGS